MSKVKEWAYEEAEKAVDNIIAKLKDGQIDLETASDLTLKVENVNLAEVDENNVDDVLYFAKEDYNSKRGKEYHGGLKQ